MFQHCNYLWRQNMNGICCVRDDAFPFFPCTFLVFRCSLSQALSVTVSLKHSCCSLVFDYLSHGLVRPPTKSHWNQNWAMLPSPLVDNKPRKCGVSWNYSGTTWRFDRKGCLSVVLLRLQTLQYTLKVNNLESVQSFTLKFVQWYKWDCL